MLARSTQLSILENRSSGLIQAVAPCQSMSTNRRSYTQRSPFPAECGRILYIGRQMDAYPYREAERAKRLSRKHHELESERSTLGISLGAQAACIPARRQHIDTGCRYESAESYRHRSVQL